MLFFSEINRFNLDDSQGRRARLIDLAIGLFDGEFPPVTHLLFRPGNEKLECLPWDAVESIDRHARQIKVRGIEAGEHVSLEWRKKLVTLGDIQDAQVLDLENSRAARANDLLLREDNGKLYLTRVDIGLKAILRRISRGLYRGVTKSHLRDWRQVEFLRGNPHAIENGPSYLHRITELPAGEISLLTDQLPYLHATELLTLLPDEIAINTLEAMSRRRQLQVFEELDEQRAIRLLEIMAPEVAADLMGRVQTETMTHYLERLSKLQCERIVELLRYPEDTVGGIMTNDIVFAPMRLTIAEARECLRERLKDPYFVYLIFIVDDEETRRQRGVIPLRDLLTRPDERTLGEIMDQRIPKLTPLQRADKAAFQVIESQLAALPVVGRDEKLIGAVTVDSAVLQVAPESWGSQAPRIFS
jgi:CBS domain-containing protein